MNFQPNLVNVIPNRVSFTVDLRNTDESILAAAEERLWAFAAQVADDEGVEWKRESLARFEPVRFDPRIIDLVERSARGLDLPVRRLPSGAGHDAQMIAALCPMGMIFVPSVGGISHSPKELTHWDDCTRGADVLLRTVLEVDRL
jgi:beta-ureidopropionase / N-carbamoyl-L-amino-acid hydrolase